MGEGEGLFPVYKKVSQHPSLVHGQTCDMAERCSGLQLGLPDWGGEIQPNLATLGGGGWGGSVKASQTGSTHSSPALEENKI